MDFYEADSVHYECNIGQLNPTGRGTIKTIGMNNSVQLVYYTSTINTDMIEFRDNRKLD